MSLRLFHLIALLCLCLSVGVPAAAQSRPVTVFAAASLKTALDEIVQAYHNDTGATVQVSYGASSALARQIQYGAPADIFISANPGWMDVLQGDDLLRDASRLDLVSNRLVLIAGPDINTDLRIASGFDLAGAVGQSWLAMALVNAVPAGLYGKAALQSLGVWDKVRDRVAQSDNVRAALLLVAVGEADFGIVYATDARADRRVRIVDVFPRSSHPPIHYPAALVRDTTNPTAAQFLGFLTDATARHIFGQNGFGEPVGGS